MGFNLGDIIVDRVQIGYAETIETEKTPSTLLYTLTQLQDVSVNITADSTDAVDNQGTLIKRFWKSKTGELTANNAMINLNIVAAAAGEGSVTSSDGNLTMPKIITARQNKEAGDIEITLGETANIVETSIRVNDFTANGTSGKAYTKGDSASPTQFVYADGKLKLPKVDNGMFIIKFERKVKENEGAMIVNKGDKFPSTIKLTLKALVVDPCHIDTLRAAYIEIPSFQVSPELEISLTTDGQLQYSGSMQMDYCSADKALYRVYYAEDDEEVDE